MSSKRNNEEEEMPSDRSSEQNVSVMMMIHLLLMSHIRSHYKSKIPVSLLCIRNTGSAFSSHWADTVSHITTAQHQSSDAALYLQICVYVEMDHDLNSKRDTEV